MSWTTHTHVVDITTMVAFVHGAKATSDTLDDVNSRGTAPLAQSTIMFSTIDLAKI